MCVKYCAGLQREAILKWDPCTDRGLKCHVPSVTTEWQAKRLWCTQKEASHCLQSVVSDMQKGDLLSLCGLFVFIQPRPSS